MYKNKMYVNQVLEALDTSDKRITTGNIQATLIDVRDLNSS